MAYVLCIEYNMGDPTVGKKSNFQPPKKILTIDEDCLFKNLVINPKLKPWHRVHVKTLLTGTQSRDYKSRNRFLKRLDMIEMIIKDHKKIDWRVIMFGVFKHG